MSLDEALYGFVLDAPSAGPTNFRALIEDNIIGFSESPHILGSGVFGDWDRYILSTDIGTNYGIVTSDGPNFLAPSAGITDVGVIDPFGNVVTITSQIGGT